MAIQDLEPDRLQETLQGMSHRHEAAFRTFYLHYQPQLFPFVRRIVRDDDLAEEVVNDVLLHVCQNPIGFEGRSRFSTWLCGIAHHKAVDVIRALIGKHKNATIPLDEPEALAIEDTTPWADVLELADRKQTLRNLQGCMDRLSPTLASLVTLAVLEEWTETELASEMNCPVGTVKSRLHAARKSLKECLANWYAEVKNA